MKNCSIFRYAGAKTKMIDVLLTHLDPMISNSTVFIDAFVGGGSVALAVAQKYKDLNIIINDLDDWMFCAWDNIIHYPNELIEKLDIVPTIEMFNEINQTEPADELDKAFRAIFFNRCCFSGIVKRDGNRVKSSPIGGKEQRSKYKVNCRYNFKKLKEKILSCHQLLKSRTTIYNLDINELINKSFISATIYLDPPYTKVGRQLYNSFMTEEQHKLMSEKLQLRNSWVLSIDDDPRIKEFYKNNQIIDLAARYSIQGKKDKWDTKNELIILK